MNGPRHYAEAERLTDYLRELTVDQRIALAQVHATLALAGATAMAAAPTHPGESIGMTPDDFIAWHEAVNA